MKVFRPNFNVVLREVPGEISLGMMVAGCPYGCKDCSYKSLAKLGTDEVTISGFEKELKENQGYASCVLFMGGEWESDFKDYLSLSQKMGYKTCLYTGTEELSQLPAEIKENLNFCKVGKWTGIPITDSKTNQKFWDVKEGKDITFKFQKKITVE